MHSKNTDIIKTGWRKRKGEVSSWDNLQDDYQIERGIIVVARYNISRTNTVTTESWIEACIQRPNFSYDSCIPSHRYAFWEQAIWMPQISSITRKALITASYSWISVWESLIGFPLIDWLPFRFYPQQPSEKDQTRKPPPELDSSRKDSRLRMVVAHQKNQYQRAKKGIQMEQHCHHMDSRHQTQVVCGIPAPAPVSRVLVHRKPPPEVDSSLEVCGFILTCSSLSQRLALRVVCSCIGSFFLD